MSLPFTLHINSIVILQILIIRTINIINEILIQNSWHLLNIGPHVLTSSRYSSSISQKLWLVLITSSFSATVVVEHS